MPNPSSATPPAANCNADLGPRLLHAAQRYAFNLAAEAARAEERRSGFVVIDGDIKTNKPLPKG
jgi:hypothetical protein